MKITRIPGHESTTKMSFALKDSTLSQLEHYRTLYKNETGSSVSLKDLVEQMVLDFMKEDKEFQRALKQMQDGQHQAEASQPARVPSSLSPSLTPTPSAQF